MSETYTIALNDGADYVITKATFDELPDDSLLYNLLKDNQALSTKNDQGKYVLVLKTPQVFKYVLQILTEQQFSLLAMREELKQLGFSTTGSIDCLKETLDYLGLLMPRQLKDNGQIQIDKIKEEIHKMPITKVREQLFRLSWELYNNLASEVAAKPFRVVFDKCFRPNEKFVGTEIMQVAMLVRHEFVKFNSIHVFGAEYGSKEAYLSSYPVKIGPYKPRISYLSLCWLMDPKLLHDLVLEYFTPVFELIAAELFGYEFKSIKATILPERDYDLWIRLKLEFGPKEEPKVQHEAQKTKENKDHNEIITRSKKRSEDNVGN